MDIANFLTSVAPPILLPCDCCCSSFCMVRRNPWFCSSRICIRILLALTWLSISTPISPVPETIENFKFLLGIMVTMPGSQTALWEPYHPEDGGHPRQHDLEKERQKNVHLKRLSISRPISPVPNTIENLEFLLGIHRGLVVMMPDSQAWVRRFESPLDPQAGWPGCYINVPHCRGLSMVLLQLKYPLELFVKRREFLPGSGLLSPRDMTYAVESDIKFHSFLPSNFYFSSFFFWHVSGERQLTVSGNALDHMDIGAGPLPQ